MAKEKDILNKEFRSKIMDEITQNENDYRKEESRRRFDIWRGNLHEEVKDQMTLEYSLDTIEKFRAQTSINLVPRIIEEKASIYKNSPNRKFSNVSEEQEQYILESYGKMMIDVIMKKANKFYKLQDQDCIQLLPVQGKIKARVLQPHHYDVIPMEEDTTQALVKIIGLNDENHHISTYRDSTERKQSRDFVDEIIGDWDDQRKELARFAWWSDNYNFMTDGFGKIISDPEDNANPMEELPFIEVADPSTKDFRYWVFKESLLTRFQIDFCKDLTDLTENTKMQGHNQGVLIALKKPETIDIGPRKWLYLPLDPNNPDARPQFDFKSPTPDLLGQMSIIQDKLAMYLSSDGIDPKTVSGSLEGETYASGIERLLAQLQKFEASSDDIALFTQVEQNFFEKYKKLNNIMAAEGFDGFEIIPDDAKINVQFNGPEKVETQDELENRWIKLREEGLATERRAIMEIYKVDKDKAEEIREEILEEKMEQEEEDSDSDSDSDKEEEEALDPKNSEEKE